MITLLLTIAAVGLIVWILVTLIPMPEPFPKVIIAIACFFVLCMVLAHFGLIHEPFRELR